MFDVVIGLVKFGSLLVTAVAGYLGIVSDFRDKAGRLTRQGRAAVVTVLVSGSLSVVLQGLETVRDYRSAEASRREALETIAKQNALLKDSAINLQRQSAVLAATDSIAIDTRAALGEQARTLQALSRVSALTAKTAAGESALVVHSTAQASSLSTNLLRTREILKTSQEVGTLSQRAFHPLGLPYSSYRVSYAVDSTHVRRMLAAMDRAANAKRSSFSEPRIAGWTSDSVYTYFNDETRVVLYTGGKPTGRRREYGALQLSPGKALGEFDKSMGRPCLEHSSLEVWLWRDSTGVLSNERASPDLSLSFEARNEYMQNGWPRESGVVVTVAAVPGGVQVMQLCNAHDARVGRDTRKVASTLDLPGSLLVVTRITGFLCDYLRDEELESLSLTFPGELRIDLYRKDFIKLQDDDRFPARFVHVLTEADIRRSW